MHEFPVARAGEFLELLAKRLSEKTCAHSVSVARTMLTMAEKVGISPEQAVTAGLLHDLCKALKPDELAVAAAEYGITGYLDSPNLLHGPVAAEECHRTLGIRDEEVLDAIRWHTTGRAGWSRVGQAIYFADFSEPLRGHDAAKEACAILERDGFESALLFVIDEKLAHVKKHHSLHPSSEEFAMWAEGEFAS